MESSGERGESIGILEQQVQREAGEHMQLSRVHQQLHSPNWFQLMNQVQNHTHTTKLKSRVLPTNPLDLIKLTLAHK